jgi:hypothetical protein
MKARNTILLVVLAAGVYFFMRYYESNRLSTQEAQEQSKVVVQMQIDDIDGITINNNETKIELRKRNNQWELDAPVKDRADDMQVTNLLDDVEALQSLSTLDADTGKGDVRDLGLVKPNLTLQLLGQNAPPEILFGKDTAIEGKEYVRLGNSNEVYIVPTMLRSIVTKKADEFRSHQIADMTATQVTKVNIKTAAGEIELQKDHDHWEINKPIKARGDDAKIGDLVAQILSARIDSFVTSEQAGTADTALGDAQGSVTLTAEGVEKPLVLEISKPEEKEPDKVFAKLSTREAPFVLPKSATAILDTKPNDVRDHHLLRLNFDTVDRIHVTPAGGPEILLARKGENWTIKSLGDKPANNGAVQTMVSAMQSQPVEFLADVATDLPRYGLDKPVLKVTFSSYASENTAETKAGEEPLETVLFGNNVGSAIWAKLEDEPFIVSVPTWVSGMAFTDALKWQDLAIYKYQPGEIVAMDVTKDGQATLSVVRDKEGWKPAKGDIALDTANLDAMASSLATLRATEWAGATGPQQELAKPAVTITFTTADKKKNTVTVGAQQGEYWYASAAGFDGTFEIGRTDHDALTTDVLPTAAPSALPSAPGK